MIDLLRMLTQSVKCPHRESVQYRPVSPSPFALCPLPFALSSSHSTLSIEDQLKVLVEISFKFATEKTYEKSAASHANPSDLLVSTASSYFRPLLTAQPIDYLYHSLTPSSTSSLHLCCCFPSLLFLCPSNKAWVDPLQLTTALASLPLL